jgi:hypothetical protein
MPCKEFYNPGKNETGFMICDECLIAAGGLPVVDDEGRMVTVLEGVDGRRVREKARRLARVCTGQYRPNCEQLVEAEKGDK